MLSALSVRNIVLIDELNLTLEGGLTALTGETGAGKSILLDALGLALGARGDQSLVRPGNESGQITAVLDLRPDHPARTLMRDAGVSDDGEVFLKRIQFADGRTRAFINDQPVSAALMKSVGATIVEIHGQHDDRAMVDPNSHRTLLDEFSAAGAAVSATREAYLELKSAQNAVIAQREKIEAARREQDYAQHTVDELSLLAPGLSEETTLAERRQALMQLEKAAEEVRDIDEVLGGQGAAGPILANLMRRLSRKAGSEDSLFAPIVASLDETLAALDRTQSELDILKRQMDFDPHELEQAEERLFALRAAARKHGVDCDGLVGVLERYREQLAALTDGESSLNALEVAQSAAHEAYVNAARALTTIRTTAAQELSQHVDAELPDLKLGAARFIVDVQTDPEKEALDGQDLVAFFVQTNPGSSPGPIMKVASGGELSRFLLALKVVLADRGSAPVLIFDEIDTGVGGAVADAIGRRLARLAERVQVLSVTHAPQVAARAATHLLIEKATSDSDGTRTTVRTLTPGSRQEEVARMLAGAEITEEARAAASRLLSEAV